MTFFKAISILFVCSGFVTAFIIWTDIRQKKQPVKIMEAVWPLTGLWTSWLGLWVYFKFGRAEEPQQPDSQFRTTEKGHSSGLNMYGNPPDPHMDMIMPMPHRPT